MGLNLPSAFASLGYNYSMSLNEPFDLQVGRSIVVVNANLISYNSTSALLFFSAVLTNNYTVTINNLMTYRSL